MDQLVKNDPARRPRLRKAERRELILKELKLHPHVRISKLAKRFGVSTETVRRDLDALSGKGLVSRAHGGAVAPQGGFYPGLDARNRDHLEERERIGRRAAGLVRPGDTVMIDSGSTTYQAARYLALSETPCSVLTNSLPIAMVLGQNQQIEVMMCPGDVLAAESAVIGVETVDFITRHHVTRCLIGASGPSAAGVTEAVRGFAAIKRAMLRNSHETHLLFVSEKAGRADLARVGDWDEIGSVVIDEKPEKGLEMALRSADVDILVAA